MAGIAGIRGTGNWATNERPQNWRQTILRLYPNGNAPLTALLSMIDEEATTDPQFNWFEQSLAPQRITVNGAQTSGATSITVATYAAGGSAGGLAAKAGTILLEEETGELILVDAAPTDTSLGTVVRGYGETSAAAIGATDHLLIIGSAFAEGASVPVAVTFDPATVYNYTQIFRDVLTISNTTKNVVLRTGDAYQRLKYDALEQHSIQMERAFIYGERAEQTSGGSAAAATPLRLTRGAKKFISTNLFTGIGDLSISTWSNYVEQIMRYGVRDKIAFCGSMALNALNQMAQGKGFMMTEAGDTTYGMALNEWRSPFGRISFKLHPLMTEHPVFRNDILIIDPNNIRYRYIENRDTQFLTDRQAPGDDKKTDEFLTECGLELNHEKTHAYLAGITGWSGV